MLKLVVPLASKDAVPVGTVFGDQLPGALKLLLPGLTATSRSAPSRQAARDRSLPTGSRLAAWNDGLLTSCWRSPPQAAASLLAQPDIEATKNSPTAARSPHRLPRPRREHRVRLRGGAGRCRRHARQIQVPIGTQRQPDWPRAVCATTWLFLENPTRLSGRSREQCRSRRRQEVCVHLAALPSGKLFVASRALRYEVEVSTMLKLRCADLLRSVTFTTALERL